MSNGKKKQPVKPEKTAETPNTVAFEALVAAISDASDKLKSEWARPLAPGVLDTFVRKADELSDDQKTGAMVLIKKLQEQNNAVIAAREKKEKEEEAAKLEKAKKMREESTAAMAKLKAATAITVKEGNVPTSGLLNTKTKEKADDQTANKGQLRDRLRSALVSDMNEAEATVASALPTADSINEDDFDADVKTRLLTGNNPVNFLQTKNDFLTKVKLLTEEFIDWCESQSPKIRVDSYSLRTLVENIKKTEEYKAYRKAMWNIKEGTEGEIDNPAADIRAAELGALGIACDLGELDLIDVTYLPKVRADLHSYFEANKEKGKDIAFDRMSGTTPIWLVGTTDKRQMDEVSVGSRANGIIIPANVTIHTLHGIYVTKDPLTVPANYDRSLYYLIKKQEVPENAPVVRLYRVKDSDKSKKGNKEFYMEGI